MAINLYMFSSPMEDKIFGNVDGYEIVTFYRYRRDRGDGNFMQLSAKPGQFSNQPSHTSIFGLSRRKTNRLLFLGLP